MSQSTNLWEGDHLSETTLQQFLNGNLANEATLLVEGHVADCEPCRSRLNHMVQQGNVADTFLVELTQAFATNGLAPPVPRLALTEQRHPDFETLASYVDGTLAREKAQELEALMKQRPQLAQEIAELRALKQDIRQRPLPEFARTPEASSRDAASTAGIKSSASSSARRGWSQWRWLVPSFGMATAMALLFFLVGKPFHKLQDQPGHSQPTPVIPVQVPPPSEDITRGGQQGGDNFSPKNPFQARLLALSNAQNQALFREVKIEFYNVRGRPSSTKVSSQASKRSKPFAFSQRWECKVGEGIQFHLRNQGRQTLYFTLLWLNQDGKITAVTRPEPNNSPVMKLTPGSTSGSQVSTLNYWIFPPVGIENIKIFVSTRPVNTSYVNAITGTGDGVVRPTKPTSPLDVALKGVLENRTSSKPSTPIDYKTWAATTHEIYIRAN